MKFARAYASAAALLALLLAASLEPLVATAQVGNEGQAQVRFQHAREFYAQHDYQHALIEFRGAVALIGSPNTRLYIARCLRELGRNAEALIEYRRAAAEAADRVASEPRYATTRDTARNEAAAIESRLGAITINVSDPPDGATVSVNGVAVASAAWGIATPFDPGDAEVTATAPDRVPFRQHITVQVGQTAVVSVRLPIDAAVLRARAQRDAPRAPARVVAAPVTHRVREGGTVRLAGIPFALVGLAAAVAGTVFYVLAVGRFNELSMDCPNGCANPNDSRISEGELWRDLAYAGWPAGGVLMVIGVAMLLVGGAHEVVRPIDNAASRHTQHWSIAAAPTTTGQGGIVSVGGAF